MESLKVLSSLALCPFFKSVIAPDAEGKFEVGNRTQDPSLSLSRLWLVTVLPEVSFSRLVLKINNSPYSPVCHLMPGQTACVFPKGDSCDLPLP